MVRFDAAIIFLELLIKSCHIVNQSSLGKNIFCWFFGVFLFIITYFKLSMVFKFYISQYQDIQNANCIQIWLNPQSRIFLTFGVFGNLATCLVNWHQSTFITKTRSLVGSTFFLGPTSEGIWFHSIFTLWLNPNS